MADDKKQPIVIKKIKKGHAGHHGGAWKVAYADFVTAMMAFFLMLWLLGSISGEQRKAIQDFFQNPSAIQGPGGASTSMIILGKSLEMPKTGSDKRKRDASDKSSAEAKEFAEEKRRLDELLEQLKESIDKSQALKPFKEQMLIDIMPDGLRIQIVDKENRPMFDLGSPVLKYYTKGILREIAKTIDKVPNRISITGHTDATPFGSAKRDYSNWELSSERANAARRELITGGMKKQKVGRVVGLASSVLFDKEDPFNPINRRISIIVMNKAAARDMGLSEDKKKEEAPAEKIKKTQQPSLINLPKIPKVLEKPSIVP